MIMSENDNKSTAVLTAESKADAPANAIPMAMPSAPGGEVPIAELHPTQLTLGYAEVLLKRQQWREMNGDAKGVFLVNHPMPAVIGPKGRHYIVDHHHLARALFEENVTSVLVTVLADLSALERDEFWNVMDYRQWVHPYDAKGHKRSCRALPKKVSRMRNDSYRSLAAAVRMAGGVEKGQTPFAEFLWAHFFRRRIPPKLLKTDPDAALTDALQMAHDKTAKHLPGWIAAARTLSGVS